MSAKIYSMTGYGKGISSDELRVVTVEMRSVNHRYLDLSIRLPRSLICFEDLVRKQVGSKISRGHIDIYINYEDKREAKYKIVIDKELASSFLSEAENLAKMGYANNLGVAEILNNRDVVRMEQQEDDLELIAKLLKDATEIALTQILKMKEVEGGQLAADLLEKVSELESLLEVISKKYPETVEEYKNKLLNKLKETLEGFELDYSRILQEVAIFADKICIDEEVTRLTAHLNHYRQILQDGGVVGKSLDFLTQEANREANTIASKSNDTFIIESSLKIKNIVEKLREQIQNIE